MSSPLSNLKKGKKAPLINATRAAPFKPTNISEEELISQLNLERKLHSAKNEQKNDVASDSNLLSSMINRLSDVEKKLADNEKRIKEKDKQINILQNKCDIYQRAKGYGNDQIAELEKKCHKLQNQVHSMESFLEDYGMIWVGNPNSSDEEDSDDDVDDFSEYDEEESYDLNGNLFSENKMWNPGCSYNNSKRKFQMNFDLVLKNIKELNTIAGEGEHYIKHTKDGARLQIKEPVPLILYANGIFMFGGPLRPYEDVTTQVCMQDIMDGYFPSELQLLYPDGVPFKVEDKRDIVFKDKRFENLFPGQGQTLSPEKGNDVGQLFDTAELQAGHRTETIDNIVQKQSVEKFLSKLPQSVMKNGKIIDIREGVKETLASNVSKNEVVVIETDAVKDIKARVNSGRSRPSTASAVTTLRIKSESGDQTYMLKMKYSDTIQDVCKHLDKTRNGEYSSYVLKTSFPNQTYTDLRKTLKEYGLVPNATLHIVKGANL